MIKTTRIVTGAAFAVAGSLAMTMPSFADMMKVAATLTAEAESPSVASSGKGALTGTYDTATKQLKYSVTYSGLTGPATAAHFHGPAPAGKNAPVLIPATGVEKSPIEGTVTLTDAQAKDLTDGMLYFNVHTAANKPGEIRGQVSASKS